MLLNPNGVPISKVQFNPPQTVEFKGGIYFRTLILNGGDIGGQHVHQFDHATMIVTGSARLWIGSEIEGDYKAGDIAEVKAGKIHVFEALEDNTRLTCIWPESIGEKLDEEFPATRSGG